MLRIALFEPRIPQNTGNIARTCAAFKVKLDLIGPLGFSLDDKYLKRAGLDYWKYMDISLFEDYTHYLDFIQNRRIIGCSKSKGIDLKTFQFHKNDVLLFGREDTGLPNDVRKGCNDIVSIPMKGGVNNENKDGVRSLNLAVSCGIITYTALSTL